MPLTLKYAVPVAFGMIDIHDSLRRYESARRRVASLDHAGLLLAFLDHLEALGLSKLRVAKYASALCTILKNVSFDPVEATKRDVERVVAWINRQSFKEWTKHDLKLALRKLIQFSKYGSCYRKTPIPDEAAWIPLNVSEKDSRVKPETLLTPDEVKAMIRAAENDRDKALISILYEAALRPAELLSMNVGSVEFKDEYCLISVHGKTGLKRIPIVASHKPLLNWLEKHPRKENLNAPLWTSLSNNSKTRRMSYQYFRKLLKSLAEKAGVNKKVWPYLFRHSCLTAMAKILTESKLELFAGWTQGSDMARKYVHFSVRDLEETILEVHGLKRAEKAEGIIKPAECPRCGKRNSPDSARCSFCGYVLDKKLATEIEEKEMEKNMEIIQRIEKLEELVKALINGDARSQASSKPQAPQE